MKSLVASILLGMPRLNRDRAESPTSATRRPTATAAPPRSSRRATRYPSATHAAGHTPETCARTRAARRARSVDDATTQHEATARIEDRQRIAADPVGRAKPALEIRRPDIVRRRGRRQRLRQRHHIPRAVGAAHSALRAARDHPIVLAAGQATRRAPVRAGWPEFFRSPARTRPAQRQHRLPDVGGDRPSVHLRRPRSLRQAMLADPRRTGSPTCRPSSG